VVGLAIAEKAIARSIAIVGTANASKRKTAAVSQGSSPPSISGAVIIATLALKPRSRKG
jgi:hypothetical protein